MAMHFKINIYANGCKIRQLIKSSPARFLFVNILHSKKEGILFTKVQRNIGYETQQKLFLNFPLFYLLRMKIQKINFPTHDILVWKIKEWEFQKKNSVVLQLISILMYPVFYLFLSLSIQEKENLQWHYTFPIIKGFLFQNSQDQIWLPFCKLIASIISHRV